MTNKKHTANNAVGGAGVGSAIGVIIVVLVPEFTEIEWTPEKAALMTAALGTVVAWAFRYLPKPRAG